MTLDQEEQIEHADVLPSLIEGLRDLARAVDLLSSAAPPNLKRQVDELGDRVAGYVETAEKGYLQMGKVHTPGKPFVYHGTFKTPGFQ